MVKPLFAGTVALVIESRLPTASWRTLQHQLELDHPNFLGEVPPVTHVT